MNWQSGCTLPCDISIVAQFLFVNLLCCSVLSFCRFIEPTILLDPPLDAEIMTEEIFGPLLPIITVRNPLYSPLVLGSFSKAIVLLRRGYHCLCS